MFRLKDEIERRTGKGSCWIDLTGIESDRQFVDVIINAIDEAEIFLFMYSKYSDKSEWTRREIEYANGENKKIVFVQIDKTPLSKYYCFMFRGHDIIDLSDKDQKKKLLDNLEAWSSWGDGLKVAAQDGKVKCKTKTPRGSREISLSYAEIFLLVLLVVLPLLGLIAGTLYVIKNKEDFSRRHPVVWALLLKIKKWIGFDYIRKHRALGWGLLIGICLLYLLYAFGGKGEDPYAYQDSELIVKRDAVVDTAAVAPQDSIVPVEKKESPGTCYSMQADGLLGEEKAAYQLLFSGLDTHYDVRMDLKVENPENQSVLFFSMFLRQKQVEGVVQNEDGKRMGYIAATLNVRGRTFELDGTAYILSGDYSYEERTVRIKGELPPDIADRIIMIQKEGNPNDRFGNNNRSDCP